MSKIQVIIKRLQKLKVCLLLLTIGTITDTIAQTWQTVGQAGFTPDRAYFTSLAFSNTGEPYVAFSDFANAYKTTVMKFDGTNWVTVGTAGFSSGRASYISLAFSNNNEPYVAYTDFANSNHATVMKFNGNNWAIVGTAGFSPGIADYSSLAFSNNGEPYIAFRWIASGVNNAGSMVMKFDGVNWVTVGAGSFSTSAMGYTSLTFGPSNEPYVAYRGVAANTTGTMVMKFDGNNWVNVGTQGFSTGNTELYNSIAFNSRSETGPYVAYSDRLNSGKVTVMKFDGTNWNTVGTAGFSAGEAKYISLKFSHTGEPYVAYRDNGNSQAATVMKFDGTNWINVGTAGFSAGIAAYTSLAFSDAGEAHVAYIDSGNLQKATVMKFASNTSSTKDAVKSIRAIYPNPADNILNIDVSESLGNEKGANMIIIDASGKTVARFKLQIGSNTLNISHLSSGVYFIKSKDNNAAKKFIKK